MGRIIEVVVSGSIRRPIDEVREQFADMEYHALANVHPRVRFTVLSRDAIRCRFRQEIRLLGQLQVDEVLNTWLPDGRLKSEVVAGTNQGLRAYYRFEGDVRDSHVEVRFEVPASGLKALMAPAFRFAAQRALGKAFEEDRQNLESGRYEWYRATQRRRAAG